GVEHVPEHLSGHHDDRGLTVDRGVAGEEAQALGAVAGDEVVVLLVRQRLDRGGVERLAAGLEREVDRELAHDRLAGPGGSRDQDALAVLDDAAGAQLEVVQAELVETGERAEDRVRRGVRARGGHANTVSAPGAHSTVRGSAPKRSPSAYDTMPGAAT